MKAFGFIALLMVVFCGVASAAPPLDWPSQVRIDIGQPGAPTVLTENGDGRYIAQSPDYTWGLSLDVWDGVPNGELSFVSFGVTDPGGDFTQFAYIFFGESPTFDRFLLIPVNDWNASREGPGSFTIQSFGTVPEPGGIAGFFACALTLFLRRLGRGLAG